MNRLQQLHDAGVSIWLDTLSRELLDTGAFARLIRDSAVTGATSNPTIFDKAITGSDRYENQLRKAVASGIRDPKELFLELALEDVGRAADLLRVTYDAAKDVTASSRSNAPPTSPTTRRPRSGKQWSCGAGSRGPTS
jgi:transaldolase